MERSIWSGNTRPRLIGILVSIIVLLEGLALAYLASPLVIEGIGGILEGTVLMGGVQLFLLGGTICLAWYWQQREVKVDVTTLAGPLLALIFAAQGLVLLGGASNVRIDGFGGVGGG